MSEPGAASTGLGSSWAKWAGGIAASVVGAVIVFFLIGPGGVFNPEPAAPTATPFVGPTRFEMERQLLARAEPITCDRYRTSGEDDYDPMNHGARGAIRCTDLPSGLRQLALFGFVDPDSLRAFWRLRVSDIPGLTGERADACSDEVEGITTWGHGEIACFVSQVDGLAKIRWIDLRTDTYGVLDATDDGLGEIVAWWRENSDEL